MDQLIVKEIFNGKMNEIIMGTGKNALKIGGDASYPFHFFEGALPNLPRIAMEVYDREPLGWAKDALEPFAEVVSSPLRWAQKCVNTFGAKAICLHLKSTDPAKENTSEDEAATLVKEVVDSIDVPIVVYGSGRKEKDALVLCAVAKKCPGKNLFLGPVVRENLQEIAQAAQEFGHGIIIQTALEISPAKEMNIKITKFLPADRILFDPTSLALGYGMEFTYSLIEQVRQGALFVNDTNLQMPFFINIGNECWSIREAKDSKERGIMWEAVTGMTFLSAGGNLLVVRHPEVYHLLEEIIEEGKKYVN